MGRGERRGGGDAVTVEFLPPDAHAFARSSADEFVDVGADSRDQFGDDGPRSPWMTFTAAAGVVAMLIVGTVSAAPWSTAAVAARPAIGGDQGPATTSTAAAPTAAQSAPPTVLTAGENPSGAAPKAVPGFIAAPPPGFEIATLGTSNPDRDPVWLELWASAGATRHTGSWFAIRVDPQPLAPVEPTAVQVDLGRNGLGALRRTGDGIAVLSFPRPNRGEVVVTAGGLPDDRLVTVAAEMNHAGNRPVLSDESTAGHELLWTGLAVGSSLERVFAYSDFRTELRYERPADHAFISVVSAPPGGAPDVLVPFVLTPDPDLLFPPSGPAVRLGSPERPLTAGIVSGLDGARIVRWVEDHESVTVISDLPLAEVLDVAAGVRRATADEWRHATAQASGFRADAAARAARDLAAGRRAVAEREGETGSSGPGSAHGHSVDARGEDEDLVVGAEGERG